MRNLNHLLGRRIGKALAGVGLCLSIVFAGSVALTSQPAQTAAASSGASVADQIIKTGEQYLGTPYQYGAKAGQTDTFDCSSFTEYVFGQYGIDLPRSSRQQAAVGTSVSKDDLQPGDLIFSDTNRDGKINHVSIYIGNGQVLQTYRVGIGVTISDFAGSVWDRTFVTARRVIPAYEQASPNDAQASADHGQSAATDNQSATADGTSGSPSADRGSRMADWK